MTKIKSITARRLGGLYQLEVDDIKALVLYDSGVRRLAELIGKLSGVEPQLERKKAAKPDAVGKKIAKAARKAKGKKSRPASETTEP